MRSYFEFMSAARMLSLLVLVSCSSSTTNAPIEVGETTVVEAAQDDEADTPTAEAYALTLGDSFGNEKLNTIPRLNISE